MLDKTKTLREQLGVQAFEKFPVRKPRIKSAGVLFETSIGENIVSLTLKSSALDLCNAEFTVRYGRIMRTNLRADEAAAELGAAILFSLIQDGKLPGGK